VFTLEEIEELHDRLGSAEMLSEYVQALAALGIESYESFVCDGHSEYLGRGGHRVTSRAVHDELPVAEISDRDAFHEHLTRHERGETSYLEMSKGLADSGIDRWRVDTHAMTMTFYDRSGQAMLIAPIREATGSRTVYEAVGGMEGLLRLAGAWHARVLADEIVSHAFSHGYHPAHTERLAAYWAEALGGPRTYSEEYGDETFVVRIHSGNGPHEDMDRRAIACFDEALADAGLADDERTRQVLHDYFAWATTTTMASYPDSADDVPADLPIPHWSWDGPEPAAART
jgi:hemoglobin